MYRRLFHITLLGVLLISADAQDEQIPHLQPGDTLYKSIDLLPQGILMSLDAETGFWDFTSLLAPYVHEVYVRPVVSGMAGGLRSDLVMMDADGIERFAAINEAGVSITGFRAPLDGKNLCTGVCDTPIPWRNTAMPAGVTETYEGTCTFSIPPAVYDYFGLDNTWNADSMRLVVNYTVTAELDGRGAMVTPGGQFGVLRERREIQSEVTLQSQYEGKWAVFEAAAEAQLPYELRPGIVYTFWSNNLPEPVAVVHTDAMDQVRRVDFKARPYGRRLVSHYPKVPDVFVYPNPSFGEVRFDFVNLEPGDYTLEIYNILGVKQRTFGPLYIGGNRTERIDLSDLKKGTYIYRLVDQNQSAIRSKRLVIITP